MEPDAESKCPALVGRGASRVAAALRKGDLYDLSRTRGTACAGVGNIQCPIRAECHPGGSAETCGNCRDRAAAHADNRALAGRGEAWVGAEFQNVGIVAD